MPTYKKAKGMKKILSTLMLVVGLIVFSGTANAQESDSTLIRTCYNTTVKTMVKDDGEIKEKKHKLKNNCFEIYPDSIVYTNERGKEFVYEITYFTSVYNDSGLSFLLNVKIDGRDMQVLVHNELKYIAIHNPIKGKTDWFFTAI